MQVPDSIGQLTRLTSLSVMQCPLEELSSSMSRLQNLRHLELETCYFLQVNFLWKIFYHYLYPCSLYATM